VFTAIRGRRGRGYERGLRHGGNTILVQITDVYGGGDYTAQITIGR
jgi:hypothetical protein